RQRSGGVRPEAGRGRERSEPGFSAFGRFPPTPALRTAAPCSGGGTFPHFVGDSSGGLRRPNEGWGKGPHCWGSGVGGSVEPVDQAGRAGGLVGGSDCPLPPASRRSAAGTFPLSPAAQGDKARVAPCSGGGTFPTSWGTDPGDKATAAAPGFLPRGAAAERGSAAGGREGARAERAGFLRFRTLSPFRLRLRGTKPGLRRAPAAVLSPTSWGTHPGGFVPQPKGAGRDPSAGAVG